MNGLQFNVAGLLKESAGAARDYEIDTGPEEFAGLLDEARPASNLRGRLRVMRTPRSLFVRGGLTTRVIMECSRCLVDTAVPIAFELEAEFFPAVDVTTGQGLPVPDDDLAFTIDANHELDIREAVRQHLLIELPIRSLCQEHCKGLCPACGADLNHEACNCAPEPVDERLAPLRALLEQASGAPSAALRPEASRPVRRRAR